ncbi:hypothetical protein ACFO9E_13895 [Streptomyces maoxianensis]|uniref:Integral membrane protein n=1 Tax=Streptomyces maoxianensis TaxID=1459942 RepID=A0ABV9G7I8_9ACTN
MTPPRPAVTAGVIAVRVIICVLVVLTLGMFAWVAMLRIAIMRRTGRDWGLFWGQLVLNLACLASLEQHLSDHWISNVGMAGLLLQMVGVVVYYLMVDVRHGRRAQVMPVQSMPPAPSYVPQQYGYGYPPAATTPRPHPPVAQQQPYVQPRVQPPVQPRVQPPVQRNVPPPRIDQVRAELDELSDYLRKDQRKDGR